MKTDARVRYTRMVIKKSFEELLREKPVSRITVKEVCEKAEINRATFYKHYLDCYDLLDKIEEEALEKFDAMLASMKDDDVQETLTNILCILKENAALLEKLHGHGLQNGFTHRLVGCCFQHMERRIPLDGSHKMDKRQQGMVYAFLAGGVGAAMEFWLQGGCVEPPEQIAEQILALTKQIIA